MEGPCGKGGGSQGTSCGHCGGSSPPSSSSPDPSKPSSSFSTSSSSAPKDYVECVKGNVPIVLTVPHGGYLAPASIATRQKGCLDHDDGSQEFARALHSRISALLSSSSKREGDEEPELPTEEAEEPGSILQPYLIICHLSRTKVDMNRPVDQAIEPGEQTARTAHSLYHGYIAHSLRECVETFGFVHLFDLHGQSHRQMLELGYMLTTDDLKRDDVALSINAMVEKSSLAGLYRFRQDQVAKTQKPKKNGTRPNKGQKNAASQVAPGFADLVRGKQSLSGILESKGFPSVPSPSHPRPSQSPPFPSNIPYFWGAYTTSYYGTLYQQSRGRKAFGPGGDEAWWRYVSTTQVEPTHPLRNDLSLREQFSDAFARTIIEFLEVNYGWKPPSPACD